MSNNPNPTAIGAFIIGALSLLVASIFIFSGDSWFSNNQKFIVVFTESINGLNVGAPIKLYGVQIGHVTEISVKRDPLRNMTLIPIVFEVDQKKVSDYIDTQQKDWNNTEVQKLIDSGLRMQLQLGSLVTGQLFIEALFLPDSPPKLYGHTTDFKEIPSIPSSSVEIQKALNNVLESTKTIDIPKLFVDLQKIITNVEKITSSKQIQSTLTAINSSALDLQHVLSTVKHDIGPLSNNLNKTINHADKLLLTVGTDTESLFKEAHQLLSSGKGTLQTVDSTLNNVKSLVNNNSPISQEIQTTLQQLSRAANATRNLVDYLERHPDALIFGKDLKTGEE